MSLIINQINYGMIKEENFAIKLMQELLDNNILMYSRHNEGMSVVAERFIKTLQAKIYKKITTDNSKSCLPYLNK